MIVHGVIFILKPLAYIFYDKKYLKGRWFEQSNEGWKWVIRGIFTQKLFGGFNKSAKFPISNKTTVMRWENINFHPDNLDNFQSPGCYIQASSDAKITIGRGTYIAPNCGIITSNHDVFNLDVKLPGKNIEIYENCWIGMNSVILPGVVLGERTIVGAGSVVTKSFPEGNQIIAGVPAKTIKYI